MKGCSYHLSSAWVVASVCHTASPLLQVVPHHQRNLPHPGVGPGWSFKHHRHSFNELQHLPVGTRGNHAVMGQLVVHCVGEGGRFVLVDWHRWVVSEVGFVQHWEHWVSWFLYSLSKLLGSNWGKSGYRRWQEREPWCREHLPAWSRQNLKDIHLIIFLPPDLKILTSKLFPQYLKVFPFDRPSPSSTSFCWTGREEC